MKISQLANGRNERLIINPCGAIQPKTCAGSEDNESESFLVFSDDSGNTECLSLTEQVNIIVDYITTEIKANITENDDKQIIESKGVQLAVNTSLYVNESSGSETYTLFLQYACDKNATTVNVTDAFVKGSSIVVQAYFSGGCSVFTGSQLENFIHDYNIEFGIAGIAVGLLVCFLGFYLLKPTIFLLGTLLVGLPILVLCFLFAPTQIENYIYFIFFGVSLVIGMAFGFLLVKVEKLGFMGVGAVLGYIVAAFLQNAVLSALELPNPEVNPKYSSIRH